MPQRNSGCPLPRSSASSSTFCAGCAPPTDDKHPLSWRTDPSSLTSWSQVRTQRRRNWRDSANGQSCRSPIWYSKTRRHDSTTLGCPWPARHRPARLFLFRGQVSGPPRKAGLLIEKWDCGRCSESPTATFAAYAESRRYLQDRSVRPTLECGP